MLHWWILGQSNPVRIVAGVFTIFGIALVLALVTAVLVLWRRRRRARFAVTAAALAPALPPPGACTRLHAPLSPFNNAPSTAAQVASKLTSLPGTLNDMCFRGAAQTVKQLFSQPLPSAEGGAVVEPGLDSWPEWEAFIVTTGAGPKPARVPLVVTCSGAVTHPSSSAAAPSRALPRTASGGLPLSPSGDPSVHHPSRPAASTSGPLPSCSSSGAVADDTCRDDGLSARCPPHQPRRSWTPGCETVSGATAAALGVLPKSRSSNSWWQVAQRSSDQSAGGGGMFWSPPPLEHVPSADPPAAAPATEGSSTHRSLTVSASGSCELAHAPRPSSAAAVPPVALAGGAGTLAVAVLPVSSAAAAPEQPLRWGARASPQRSILSPPASRARPPALRGGLWEISPEEMDVEACLRAALQEACGAPPLPAPPASRPLSQGARRSESVPASVGVQLGGGAGPPWLPPPFLTAPQGAARHSTGGPLGQHGAVDGASLAAAPRRTLANSRSWHSSSADSSTYERQLRSCCETVAEPVAGPTTHGSHDCGATSSRHHGRPGPGAVRVQASLSSSFGELPSMGPSSWGSAAATPHSGSAAPGDARSNQGNCAIAPAVAPATVAGAAAAQTGEAAPVSPPMAPLASLPRCDADAALEASAPGRAVRTLWGWLRGSRSKVDPGLAAIDGAARWLEQHHAAAATADLEAGRVPPTRLSSRRRDSDGAAAVRVARPARHSAPSGSGDGDRQARARPDWALYNPLFKE